ncbi:EAL domain-containing protein [Marinomonas sp. FW-1]|nr:EAL domain-containing protein [Marinomonas sp. FW-1]
MEGIFSELKRVVDNAQLSCEEDDVKRLKRLAFYSDTFKEFGLFDRDFRVFCSNYGAVDIPIFSSIVNRIERAAERKTVSLVHSKSLGNPTLFAFYQGENGIGANGLAPPVRFSTLIDPIILPNYFYELTIGKRILSSNRNGIDSDIWNKEVVSLDDWSMRLDVYLPSNLYWQRLHSLIPFIFIGWLFLFFAFYNAHLIGIYFRRSLRHCVRRAIKNAEIEVYFQPVVSLNPGEPLELEALLRWKSLNHGQVSPLVVVKVASQLGLMDELTWLVIRKVGAFYREYPDQLIDIKTSVNVDRFSLLKESFAPKLVSILEEYPELIGRLGLEVTETSALNHEELPVMVSRFEQITALGIGLSVDDFGTGYSGLDFLRRFPYDTLKLDQVFIANLKDDQFTRQVLTSISILAKELGMKLVAEGVEREDQLNDVRLLGVDRVQGYYFCKPLPKDQIITWMTFNNAV